MTSSRYQEYLDSLPTTWTRERLGFLGEVFGGGTPSREVAAYWGGDIPWVTPGELSDGGEKHVRFTKDSISAAGLAASGAVIVPAETLLVTTRATLGRSALAERPMATNQGFKNTVFDGRSSPDFYFHLTERLKSEIVRRASGTTFLEISSSQFADIEVPVPPIDEQRRIAEILDTVDDAIAAAERVIAKLEQEREGLREELLRGVADGGEWRESALQELASAPICYGIVQPGRHDPSGTDVVTIRDLLGNFGDGLHRASPQIEARYARSRIGPGDVLLSVKATIGRMAVVPSHFRGNISRDVARVRLGPRLLPGYLLIALGSHAGQKLLQRAVVGTTRAELSIGPLQRLQLRYPEVADQQRAIAVDDAASFRIRTERSQLAKVRSMRAGFADDLLSGRVRTVPA